MSEIKAGLKDVVVAKSQVSSINGDIGELIYSGINIHELAENATFEEVVFLLLNQRLPNAAELADLDKTLKSQRGIPAGIDTNALRAALAKLLGDRDLTVKAHALVAASGSPLDDVTTVAAAPCIQDGRTLIRLQMILQSRLGTVNGHRHQRP